MRLRARDPAATAPIYLGLVHPGTHAGAFANLAPTVELAKADDSAALDYLAVSLYGGDGPAGLFNKTWSAGLAYSNGASESPDDGLLTYYADNCPEPARTMRFAAGVINGARPEASLLPFAIASGFGSRLGRSYQARGRAIAEELLDGPRPDAVRRFRERLLQAARRPDLLAEVTARFAAMYAKVIPGVGATWKPAPDAFYLVVGSDEQLDGWQQYLREVAGAGAKLTKLYPRDFWIPATAAP
jgi:hypothetical protein